MTGDVPNDACVKGRKHRRDVSSRKGFVSFAVRDIGTFGLRLIAPGHCTGWRAVNALANAYGDSTVAPLAVGKIFAI